MEKETFYFLLKIRKRRVLGFPSRVDDNRALRIQPIEKAPDGFAQPPFDPVPHHGFSNRARNRKADSRAIELRLADPISREQRAGKTGAHIINPSEIFRAQEADTFRKTSDGSYLSALTVSFLRPRARLRDNTARPS